MTSYTIELKRSAEKELDAITDEAIYARLDRKILALRQDPRPPGCVKLSGYANQWRIRSGDWRVLYSIDDAARRVMVTHVKPRREAYEP